MQSEVRKLADEYKELTGYDIFCYASQPTPGGIVNYVFQEGVSFRSRTNAIEYLRLKLAQARNDRS